mmetsp:Transcript_71067/g.191334  ORF Transcript_71067/g.191334 Transcript_71067/m.191334 type:complete len:352 (+) Transcript_71067:1853-2908(+)
MIADLLPASVSIAVPGAISPFSHAEAGCCADLEFRVPPVLRAASVTSSSHTRRGERRSPPPPPAPSPLPGERPKALRCWLPSPFSEKSPKEYSQVLSSEKCEASASKRSAISPASYSSKLSSSSSTSSSRIIAGMSGGCSRSRRTGGVGISSSVRAPKGLASRRDNCRTSPSCPLGERGAGDPVPPAPAGGARSSGRCRKRSSTSASWSESRFERLSSSVSREVISQFCCRTSSNCCRVSSSCLSMSRSRCRRLRTASVCAGSAVSLADSNATMRSTRNCTRVSLSPHCFVVSLSRSTPCLFSCDRTSFESLSCWFSAVSASMRWESSCSERSTSSMCASICATYCFSFVL